MSWAEVEGYLDVGLPVVLAVLIILLIYRIQVMRQQWRQFDQINAEMEELERELEMAVSQASRERMQLHYMRDMMVKTLAAHGIDIYAELEKDQQLTQ